MFVARIAFMAFLILMPSVSLAQVEFSLYGGTQRVSDGRVLGSDPGGVGWFDFNADWVGSGTSGRPNYGLRVTWWQNDTFGWGVEMNHTQIRLSEAVLAPNRVNALNFSGDVNLVTVNAYRRWKTSEHVIVPYVGAGLGLAIPDVTFDSGDDAVSGPQVTGPAVQWIAGASYPVTERISVFGEYRGSFAVNNVELAGFGALDTSILSNAFNIGVSLGF